MKCPICKEQIKDESKFCEKCGNKIPRCPSCGKVVYMPSRFCVYDGTPLPDEMIALFAAEKGQSGNFTSGNQETKPSRGNGSKKGIIIALVIVVIVLVLGIAAFFIARTLILERDSESDRSDVSVERESEDEGGVIDRSGTDEEDEELEEERDSEAGTEDFRDSEKEEDSPFESTEEPAKEMLHTYEVIVGDYSWQEAKSLCEEMGGYLATVTSVEEYETISSLAEDSGLTYLWLGGSLFSDTSEWGDGCWITDEQWTFEKWYPGEPSREDADGTKENYLCLWNAKYDGENIGWTFNDQRNDIVEVLPSTSGSVGFVCEYETEVD